MCAVIIPAEDQEGQLRELPVAPPALSAAGGLPRFVKAEANLLRLPLFALSTKGLKSLDGIECSGRITRDGQTHAFTFRATRNTATVYPGPLARSAHLAFLSLVTDAGLPLEGPLSWKWRDLCRRSPTPPKLAQHDATVATAQGYPAPLLEQTPRRPGYGMLFAR